MSDNPTVYAQLLDNALADPLPSWNQSVRMKSEQLRVYLEQAGLEAMRDAYVSGVADGYRQGVAAECARADAERRASRP